MTRSALTLVAVGLAGVAVASLPMALAPGDAAPPLAGTLIADGRPFQAHWDSGTLKLVNFWATWCEPCKKEMPLLDELYRRGKERGLEVFGVLEPWEADRVGAFLTATPVSYPIILPEEGTVERWGAIGIKPTSFLIDAKGKVLRRYVGAQPEQAAGLVDDVEAVLDGRPLPAIVLPSESVLPQDVRERAAQEGQKLE
jgi:thiol-disulfide isomerase/thioredoxin